MKKKSRLRLGLITTLASGTMALPLVSSSCWVFNIFRKYDKANENVKPPAPKPKDNNEDNLYEDSKFDTKLIAEARTGKQRPKLRNFDAIKFESYDDFSFATEDYLGIKWLAKIDWGDDADVLIPGLYYYGIYLKTLLTGKHLNDNNKNELFNISERKNRLIEELKFFDSPINEKTKITLEQAYRAAAAGISSEEGLKAFYGENGPDKTGMPLEWYFNERVSDSITFIEKDWPAGTTKNELVDFVKKNTIRFYDRLNNVDGWSIKWTKHIKSLNNRQKMVIDDACKELHQATKIASALGAFEIICDPTKTVIYQLDLYKSLIAFFNNIYALKLDKTKPIEEQLKTEEIKESLHTAIHNATLSLRKMMPAGWDEPTKILTKHEYVAFQYRRTDDDTDKEMQYDKKYPTANYYLFNADNPDWDHSQARFVTDICYYLKEFLLPLAALIKLEISDGFWGDINFLYDKAKLCAQTNVTFNAKDKPINFENLSEEECKLTLKKHFEKINKEYEIFGKLNNDEYKTLFKNLEEKPKNKNE